MKKILNFSSLFIALISLSSCMHCGPECQESRKPKPAFITDGCKTTLFGTRECTDPAKAKSGDKVIEKATTPSPEEP